jgi:hypothetical protein
MVSQEKATLIGGWWMVDVEWLMVNELLIDRNRNESIMNRIQDESLIDRNHDESSIYRNPVSKSRKRIMGPVTEGLEADT